MFRNRSLKLCGRTALLASFVLSLAPSVALAEEVSPALFAANNVWMMIAAALVFVMHLGFAMVESGLTRATVSYTHLRAHET